MMKTLAVTLTTLLLAPMLSAQIAPDAAKIAAVEAGELKEAKASWWGFDPVDSTAFLQAAIDSGVPKLTVEKMDSAWIVTPMQLVSDQEIVFEDGCIVEAKKGEFKAKNDSLFTASLKENVTLRGYGATLRMHRSDYDGPDYDKAEWRMVLRILSSTSINVYGLILTESGGDGIYLGVSERGVTNTDIHIKDVTCDKNYRQGISVISAENLLIEDTVLSNTGGTAPQAGIDFEPNAPGEKIVNCVMRNCRSENNNGAGYVLYLNPLNGTSDDISVLIEDCTSIGNSISAGVSTVNGHPEGDPGGLIEFVSCTFEGSRGSGINIYSKPADGCRVRFENCTVTNPAADAPNEHPISFRTRAGDGKPIGGVVFEDCTIEDPVDRVPLTLHDWAGAIGFEDVTGNLTLIRGGQRTGIELTEETLAEWMPMLALRAFDAFDIGDRTYRPYIREPNAEELAKPSFRMRRAQKLVTHAVEGDEVSWTVRYHQLAKYSGEPMPVRIDGPTGDEVTTVTVEFEADTPMTFTAPVTGVYAIHLDAGGNWAQITDATHPMCLDPGEGVQRLYGSTGDLYFHAPGYVPQFAVKVYGENTGEAIRAALYDAEGELVEEQDNITMPAQFIVTQGVRKEPGPGSVYRLHIQKPTDIAMEDYNVQLQGIPPLLAFSRDGLLVLKED